MSNLTILRSYAQKSNPAASLPPSILFRHTPRSLTIFDGYPKAIFHFLLLPRIREPFNVFDLANLRTMLRRDKAQAKKLILGLLDDATTVRKEIEQEMMNRYGFKWDVWIGFHAVPSMEHLHVHIISSDLCSPTLKTKKHYNSFHPKHGFFLHLEAVLSWFDAEPSYYATMSKLEKSRYEPILKEDLSCWRCRDTFKNMPTLKAHLQEEFDQETKREKARVRRQEREKQAEADMTSTGDSANVSNTR